MDLVVAHNRPDAAADDDPRPLHRSAFDRLPRPFVDRRVEDLIGFDAGIVALLVAPIPVDENSQLHIVNLVFPNHHMRCVDGTYPAPFEICAEVSHFKTLDPNPIAGIHVECVIEIRRLPVVVGRTVLAADVESGSGRIVKPTLLDRRFFMPATLFERGQVIVVVETILVTRQVCDRSSKFSEPYFADSA